MATLDTLLPSLRRLKLSGMLDAIPARAEQARSRDLDVLDSCCCYWRMSWRAGKPKG